MSLILKILIILYLTTHIYKSKNFYLIVEIDLANTFVIFWP